MQPVIECRPTLGRHENPLLAITWRLAHTSIHRPNSAVFVSMYCQIHKYLQAPRFDITHVDAMLEIYRSGTQT